MRIVRRWGSFFKWRNFGEAHTLLFIEISGNNTIAINNESNETIVDVTLMPFLPTKIILILFIAHH